MRGLTNPTVQVLQFFQHILNLKESRWWHFKCKGLKARSNNAKCIDTTCTKSGKKCLSVPSLPDTLPQKTREEYKANNPDQKFDEEEYQALKSNITLGCNSPIPQSRGDSQGLCVCVGKIILAFYLNRQAVIKSEWTIILIFDIHTDTKTANKLEAVLGARPGRAHEDCSE